MTYLRKSSERGAANHGWLKSMHTFSFANYHDPQHMGFGPLRVINEDRIQGGTGFSSHGHQDMEIISYVIHGALRHKDSMGNESIIHPGEVQRMSAGTGVIHSEFNHLHDQETHFLQIWILPEKQGLPPGYQQKSFSDDFAKNDFIQVISHHGSNGTLSLNQDINMYIGKASQDGEFNLKTRPQRFLWVQMIRGDLTTQDISLSTGDGLGLTKIENLKLQWKKNSEFIVFDMA